MKKLTFLAIVYTIWAGVFSQESIHQINDKNESFIGSYHPSDFEAFVEAWRTQPQIHAPGLSTCVLKNGELYWVFHSGLANLEQEIPVNDSSVFNVASVSKTPIITAIMQFYEQGEFELEDSAGMNLEFPIFNPHFSEDTITHYQVMTHTSTILDGSGWANTLAQYIQGYFIPGGSLWSPSNFSAVHSPGDDWFYYSNVGSCLLAYITEVMASQDYNYYCLDSIFQPLGMYSTSYDLADINASNMVTHYSWNGSYQSVNWGPGHTGGYPAGGLITTAIDLAKFLGMYMKGGNFNGNTILQPETIELITTPTGIVGDYGSEQCLIWSRFPSTDNTHHSGGTDYASSIIAYDKDDQCGNIMLMNGGVWNEAFTPYLQLAYFSNLYDAISIANLEINDDNGNLVIEANETFELGLTLRNDMNYPSTSAENLVATISVNSPYVHLISDSVATPGTLNYLEEIQLPSNQFIFEVTENLEPGIVEFQIHFTWENGVGYTTKFNLFIGHADVLLVRDEDNISICLETGVKKIQDAYLESLDTLGFLTSYWDLEVMGDPTADFIQSFPAVIWFTGADEENTLSENNQSILAGYLDNGGQLFLSGQDISDELAGTDFLGNYLFTEHIQDTWSGNETIKGMENDPIGNGQIYQVNQGDGIASQNSMSVIGPLGDAYKVFGYNPSMEGAATRFDNNTYKTVFFAFGFEAINGFENRTEILGRILNDYFIIPHPCLPEGITFSSQEQIDNFESGYPGCIEVEGDVTINGDDILNLDGLEVLTAIGGDLTITGNDLLNDLSGLVELKSIGGKLEIIANESLTSLAGLDSVAAASITDLSIYYNFELSECAIASICEYLDAPNGIVEIHDNKAGGGCVSQAQVSDICTVFIPEMDPVNGFAIAPNPFSDNVILQIITYETGSVLCDLYEVSGVKIKQLMNEEKSIGIHKKTIDLSELKPGVYYCALKTNDHMQTIKLIKTQ